MQYEYRTNGNVTYRVRARARKQHGERRQDEHGRFYFDSTEKRSASGNMIELHLWFTREDKEIGKILFQKIWIWGSNNHPHFGPKRWQAYLEENLDMLIEKAIKTYNKQYNTSSVELVMFEGWRIIKKKVINLSDCVYYPSVPTIRKKLSKEEHDAIFGNGT